MIKQNNHAQHRERVKARFLENGLSEFTDFEILEFLLYYAIPRKDTAHTAKLLIEKFGSLSRVLEASMDELCGITGVSGHTAVLLRLIPGLARAYISDSLNRVFSFKDYDAAGRYFVTRFIGTQEEEIYVAFLDNSMNLIECRKFQVGDENSTFISTRTLSKESLALGATHIMIAHNHPQGIAIPSSGDLNATKAIKSAMELLGISLDEHFVISGEKYMGILQMRSGNCNAPHEHAQE